MNEIRSEMPAKVVFLRLADGASVSAGETVLILESMKMEIPVSASVDGTLKYYVEAGQIVERGDLLATVL